MSDIQPLKEDVVHAGTLEDPIPQKIVFVKKDSTGAKKVYTLGMGGTIGGSDVNVSNASDTVVGIVKLTDDATLDAPAATGYTALTPNGAKVAINSAIDDALADGGKLDNAIDDAIQDKIESGEIGAGSSEASTLVVKPKIITPTEGAVNVASLPTLQATAFKCLLTTETRLHREFELNTVTPDASVLEKQVNADSITLDSRLNPNTQYKWRCRDVTNNGLKSAWTSWTSFTTAEGQTVTTPTITLKGYQDSPTDILSGLTIEGSAFAVTEGEDTHRATSWSIAKKIGTRSNVWESLNDTTHKTQITVPDGTLEKGTAYTLTVIYHGTAAYDSAPAVVEFTTSNDFGTVNAPTLTVQGGPNTVYETPTLTGGAFSNTRDPDTHEMTDWEIIPQAGGAAVWQSLNDATNKTTIKVSKGRLAAGTAYTARVRYKGLRYGWSDWQSVQFNTVAAFSSINTPTLTVDGAPNSVLETPTLTLSAFGGDNATHKNTHFKVLKNDDNSEVWSTSVAAPAVSTRVPVKTLQANTTYKFQGWYEAVEGVTSAVAEVVATTKQTFVEIGDIGRPDSPSFGVGIPSDEVAESFIPGIQKHPDFYDETKPGYGTWVVPETLIKNTTKWDGAFKFIPKFYWMPLFNGDGGEDYVKSNEELEAILPYVDVTLEQMNDSKYKYPCSAIVIAKAGAFKNEADANAHGFILPAAFIDGGKEKDGFFISSTLASYSIKEEDGLRKVTAHLGENYESSSSQNQLWRLTSLQSFGDRNQTKQDLGLSDDLYDAVRISKSCNENLNCESFSTVAALALLSLAIAQYSKSTEETAWYDSNGQINFPKGINAGSHDADDNSVAVSNSIGTSTGDMFPTTSEGYKKTTHNGRINGLTHVNGWLVRPMVGFGSLLSPRANYIFNPTKHSITEITVDNVDFSKDRTVYDSWVQIAGNEWDDAAITPLYVDKTGVNRLQNCFTPHPSGHTPSARFGLDYYDYRGYELMICGGGVSGIAGGTYAGMFYRNGVNLSGRELYWAEDNPNYGFHAIGYPLKNSDGTTGNEAFLISDDTSPFHGVSVLINPQDREPVQGSREDGYDISADISVSFPSEQVMNETEVSLYTVSRHSTTSEYYSGRSLENGSVSNVAEATFTKRYTATHQIAADLRPSIQPFVGIYIKLSRNGGSRRVIIYDIPKSDIHSWTEFSIASEESQKTPWGGQ